VIQYSLRCSQGHSYDAWFKNAQAFDDQQARGIVVCAVCGDGQVEKALMAPAVARTDSAKVAVSAGHPDPAQLRQLLKAFKQKVLSEAENVGDRFAEEARKIHYEEAEARGIYGQASRDEVVALAEEGIEFLPLPDLPEEHN
jgi:hypothetical protein